MEFTLQDCVGHVQQQVVRDLHERGQAQGAPSSKPQRMEVAREMQGLSTPMKLEVRGLLPSPRDCASPNEELGEEKASELPRAKSSTWLPRPVSGMMDRARAFHSQLRSQFRGAQRTPTAPETPPQQGWGFDLIESAVQHSREKLESVSRSLASHLHLRSPVQGQSNRGAWELTQSSTASIIRAGSIDTPTPPQQAILPASLPTDSHLPSPRTATGAALPPSPTISARSRTSSIFDIDMDETVGIELHRIASFQEDDVQQVPASPSTFYLARLQQRHVADTKASFSGDQTVENDAHLEDGSATVVSEVVAEESVK